MAPTELAAQSRIALDQTACLREQSNIGETIIHNICDGTATVVPWGSADWLAAFAIGGVVAFLAVMLVVLTLMVIGSLTGRW